MHHLSETVGLEHHALAVMGRSVVLVLMCGKFLPCATIQRSSLPRVPWGSSGVLGPGLLGGIGLLIGSGQTTVLRKGAVSLMRRKLGVQDGRAGSRFGWSQRMPLIFF